MVRLAISVEGLTEEIFVEKLIVPHLLPMNIHAIPLQLGDMGGDVSLSRIKKDLNHLAKSFDKVTTLYDFYGFRGKAEGESKQTLERKIMDRIAPNRQNKIIPYVQMHEFEGILFSSPEAMESNIQKTGLARWANDVLQKFGNDPEKINDSPQTAPSKLLLKKADYIKTVHGPNIAEEIGLDVLREKCTGFNDWLSKLEALN